MNERLLQIPEAPATPDDGALAPPPAFPVQELPRAYRQADEPAYSPANGPSRMAMAIAETIESNVSQIKAQSLAHPGLQSFIHTAS